MSGKVFPTQNGLLVGYTEGVTEEVLDHSSDMVGRCTRALEVAEAYRCAYSRLAEAGWRKKANL